MKEILMTVSDIFSAVLNFFFNKKIQKTTDERNEKRLKKVNEPYFIGLGGHYRGNEAECKFKNAGGPIKNITFIEKGDFSVTIQPNRLIHKIDQQEEGILVFRSRKERLDFELPFDIKYEYDFGSEGIQSYICKASASGISLDLMR